MASKPFIRLAPAVAALVLATLAWPAQTKTNWQQTDGVRIPVPPPEHLRLYLRAEHVRLLSQRLKDPMLQPAVERLQSQARKSPQFKADWDALQYLVTRDRKLGRTIIEATLPLLAGSKLADRQDACRETGRMTVTGAIVYDWCYSLLTSEERQAFIKELVRLAETPPGA